ncbi:hypothetical protein AvCA_09070 [Azotobacter vinelandii CA]|uniref:Uncharacterized protein n=2 Tax=Azotobacter vinelandii TaxID=354 RepID=C1DMW6_AZOVD|nr:hypothetical protein Avin_09070 [Azotobacter vinelandii DJ]AGK17160.1 hypothetical protein AvCA_09070 [Azotobacter vinelandii CA]AGK19587.1 hypothetical protein AvCA6_09070 [Azotobacter vinelandii CA6]
MRTSAPAAGTRRIGTRRAPSASTPPPTALFFSPSSCRRTAVL